MRERERESEMFVGVDVYMNFGRCLSHNLSKSRRIEWM